MTTTDTYNGWTNRETWAVNLWLTNDEWLNEELQGIATGPGYEYNTQRDERLREFIDELLDPSETPMNEESRKSMQDDIGSLWRVNWAEIIDAAREE